MITTVNDSAGEELLEEWREKTADMEKRLAKEDAKRWVPIEADLSLAEALRRLSKQELNDIRVSLAVTGASSLNKSQLADKLAEELPSRMGALLERMDEEQYRIVKSAADRGGVLPDPGNRFETAYFLRLGLLYPGTIDGARVVVMPAEVREAFKAGDSAALRKSVRDRSQLVRLATGALYYYGALPAGKLAELLAPHLGGALDEGELRDILAGREEFAGGLQQGDYGFADDAALEPESIVREHESRPELPYYPFSKEQLLEAGSLEFIDRNLSYRTFANFLAVHYEMEKDEIDEVLQDLVFNIQNGASPSELMELLQDGFEMDAEGAAQSFIAHLTALFNHTRMWALKGYTPNELAEAARREAGAGEGASEGGSAIVPAPARKIGRNEPCPCGSGKKYKKCCAG